MPATDDRLSTGSLSDGDSVPDGVSATSRTERLRLDRLAAIAPFLAALLVPVWVSRRPLFSGQLFGDITDARWTIAVHEHWFAVWHGRESVRDMQYFFPVRGTLGTSDAFFVQGQFYSLARAFGLGLVDSWVLAQLVFFVLGAMGLAVLSRQVLATWWAQVAFVGLTCASYPLLVSLNHVQMLGFLWASWVFVGAHAVLTGAHPRIGLALVIVVPPLLALSSWYACVLLAFIVAPLAIFVVLFSRPDAVASRLRFVTRAAVAVIRSPVGILLLVVFVVAWASVLWMYLPGSRLLAAPAWTEVMIFGPKFYDIVNASGGGGGLWSPLYAGWPKTPGGDEHWLGFTPVLLLALLLIGLLLIRSAILGRPDRAAHGLVGRAGLIAVLFTVISSVAIFLMDGGGQSIYRLFWTYVPGLQSVRAPFRIQVYEYALALFFLLRACEYHLLRPADGQVAVRRRRLATIGAALLVVLVAVEMQRPVITAWREAQLLPQALQAQIQNAQHSCDAVIVLNEPKVPSFLNRIDGVMFSVLSGLPTPQGYSRGVPVGYPDASNTPALAVWMREQGGTGRICSVSPKEVQLIP